MKSLVIVLVLIIISTIILLTVMNVTGVVNVETKIERSRGRDVISVGEFYSKVDPWKKPEGDEIKTIPGSSIFTVYTYEKANGIQVGTPNVKNLITDFELKRCHQTITGKCLDPDQIEARYESRECKEDCFIYLCPTSSYVTIFIKSLNSSILVISKAELC